jgi:hypothetical protein
MDALSMRIFSVKFATRSSSGHRLHVSSYMNERNASYLHVGVFAPWIQLCEVTFDGIPEAHVQSPL